MQEFVSVVVPVYNNASTLRETLTSILGQTYPYLKVIISDHASTDESLSIARDFETDPRVTVTTYSGPRGAHFNWNYVTRLADGEYLTLVCGDDLIVADSIEKRVDALRKFPNSVLVSAQKSVISHSGRTLIRKRGLGGLKGLVPAGRAIRRSVQLGQNIFGEPMSVLFRRRALEY